MGDGFDHFRPGDEHVSVLVEHKHKIIDAGRIHRAAGAGAHDQRDLRNDAGSARVAVEDLAIRSQRINTFLDACAAGIVQADERGAVLVSQVHQPGRSCGRALLPATRPGW